MSWLTKLNQEILVGNVYRFMKKRHIWCSKFYSEKKDKSITIRGIKHKTNIKKKNRKYIYVYL